jgi:hypothetical protein
MSVKGRSGGAQNYFGSIAGVIGAGPYDWLSSMIIDGKTVWPTDQGWADDIIEVPVVGVERRGSGASRITMAAQAGLVDGDYFVASGIPAPYDTFNCATKTKVSHVSNSGTTIAYRNANLTPVVAPHSVGFGTVTKVVHYTSGSVVRYLGAIWRCVLTHDGLPSTAPPNPTYWTVHRVLRADEANPYAFTVADSIVAYGQAYFYWGTVDQELRSGSFLLKNGHPPYRRQALLELENFLFGTERQGAPNIQIVGGRNPAQSLITGDSADVDADGQANPLAGAAALLVDPVFGMGLAGARLDGTSWQATADELAAASGRTYFSMLLDQQNSARSFFGVLLAYYDGWLRFAAGAKIEAGRFLHNEAPPSFTAATTIDYNDLVEEVEWEAPSWSETFNEVVCKFADRGRAWKDAGQMAISSYNRQIVGEPRRTTVDRPWITREGQASEYAGEWAKIYAQPSISGNLVVRAEKAASIRPGDLFELTHDALEFSVVCRCVEKTYAMPPVGHVTLRFESEQGIAPIPYQPTVSSRGGTTLAPAEAVTLFQFVQPPPTLARPLATGKDFELMVLAARTNPLSLGLRPWLKVDDAESFYELGEQRGWSVTGTLAADYGVPVDGETAERGRSAGVATLKVVAHGYLTGFHVKVTGLGAVEYNVDDTSITVIDADHFSYVNAGADEGTTADTAGNVNVMPDDDSGDLEIELNEETVAPDLERIGATQTADAINDNALLIWLFSAADTTQFEVATVKQITLESGVYKVKVRRGRYATTRKAFVSGDGAWIVFREDLVSYSHAKFAQYAQTGGPATFRLQAFTKNGEADLSNPDLCPDIDFTFGDPYAPTVNWELPQVSVAGVWTDITNFETLFSKTDIFRFGFEISAPNGALVEARLVGRLGSVELTLWAQSFVASGVALKATTGSLTSDGCWSIILVVKDSSNRVIEFPLTVPVSLVGHFILGTEGFGIYGTDGAGIFEAGPGGEGLAIATICIGSGSQVIMPVVTPAGATKSWQGAKLTLSCATPGATIYYQVHEYLASAPAQNAPGNGWSLYATPFVVNWGTGKKTIWYYATKAGLTQSFLGRDTYAYSATDSGGGGGDDFFPAGGGPANPP